MTMDTINIILAAIASGLLATIITIIVQKNSEIKRTKVNVFEILMSHRYLITDKENVEALNKVEVIFHDDKDVKNAWKDFLDAADHAAESDGNINNIDDKYLKLLEKISISIDYKNINWEDIKRCYYPQGLSTQIMEESMLRTVQLEQALKTVQQDEESFQTSIKKTTQDFFVKTLEGPNGVDNLIKLMKVSDEIGLIKKEDE